MRGHLKKRSSGSWTAWIEEPRSPNGKRKQRVVTIKGTKREAEARLAQIIHEQETGLYVSSSKLKVADFLRQWLDSYVTTNVRAKTEEGYRIIVERHLVPALGNIPLKGLQATHLQSYYAKALSEGRRDGRGGLSATTVHRHHRVLSEALNHAVKWGLVARNVAQTVDPPRPQRFEPKVLDSDGVQKVLEAAEGTPYHALLHLDIYTGLRRSEILGLRWKDVDLLGSSLSVTQSLHQLMDRSIVFEAPKTAKGRRMVALSPVAVISLRTHKERRQAECLMLGISFRQEGLVFCHPDSSPFLPNTLTHAFRKILNKAGLSGVRLHDLRHTHATLMLRQGVHPKIVSERLGHATVAH